ncbi:hypothetical protein [Candidimonas nitroreducens]|uniref:Uncharacterized protein n=1 Tax=Candidimonas nitroreducens TaxID=683354 RepID=A0A225M3V5_9BURK|nr:hypothetical protein [Candidimonas nitroreducens]OWT54221.1 hypothetical protein CEY11_22925 [Candidimonas nitroreducens]
MKPKPPQLTPYMPQFAAYFFVAGRSKAQNLLVKPSGMQVCDVKSKPQAQRRGIFFVAYRGTGFSAGGFRT